MAYLGPVCRWEIFWADLEPAVGREQAGESRPVLVVSNDVANDKHRLATIVPLTKLEGKNRRPYAFEVALPRGSVEGSDYTPLAIVIQIRTLSRLRLLGRCGHLADRGTRERIEDGMLTHLGIELDE